MDIPQGNASVDKKDKTRIRRIVFFGRIHKVKAIDNLVNAWGDLSPLLPQWELVIAGPDCGAKTEIEEIINCRKIPRVRFIGELNGQAKYNFLSDADIYVLPSHTENFGVTVAEALASGVPVIASQGTPWEGLEKEKCGRWIPIGIEPLKNALEELTALSDEKRQEMGKCGQDWIRRDFSWEGIGAKMKEAYTWLLGQGDKPDCVRVN
jgi:glycosyltransferase involved in cell wall biosynthesis